LRDLPPPAADPVLSVADVDAAFARAAETSGPGSVAVRRDALASLFGRATEDEQRFLVMLAGGELRQGALAGIMVDAVARAAGVEAPAVRRAAMLAGDLPAVAMAALAEGAAALDRFRLQVGRPLQPMLAKTATSVEAAMEQIENAAAVDWKLDGVRIQVHRDGDEVSVFTRTLDPITDRMPEVVEAALALPVRSIVLDGEAIALRPDGRPRPFQETASRAASRGDVDSLRRSVPLTPFFFDVLSLDGTGLIDLSAAERQASIEGVVPADLWVPRLVTDDVGEATSFFDDAVGRGHEGVVVKDLSAPYEAGRRGGAWLKVKPVHTLDLVVLAAEWGHGRRRGWLSNLHLGARDPETGAYVMLGKTFKGLTDELLRWQTERLLELESRREGITVYVRPDLVVEIAFDGIQSSPRYPAGMALRFARVIRYREDKRPEEADTVETVRTLHQAGL
jgi:DNA ligase-1